jgi:hypothetical protein
VNASALCQCIGKSVELKNRASKAGEKGINVNLKKIEPLTQKRASLGQTERINTYMKYQGEKAERISRIR